jgi:hypothetical protein
MFATVARPTAGATARFKELPPVPDNDVGAALEERVRQIVTALPETSFLRNYVIYASHMTDCNAAYHLVGGLCLLAQTIPDDLYVRIGSKVHGNVYALAVGPSSVSRKTASVQTAREIIEEALPGASTPHPGSHEGLSDALSLKPRQLLLYDEFSTLLAQAEGSYMSPIKNVLTNVYDGAAPSRSLAQTTRRKAGIPDTKKSRLSLFGAVTPGYLSAHSSPSDWIDGFFARFFIVLGERVRTNDKIGVELPEHKAFLIQSLKERSQVLQSFSCIGMSHEAEELWKGWRRDYARTAKNVPREVSGAAERANGHVLKAALLLAWDEGTARATAPWQLEAQHLWPAIRIAEIHIDSIIALADQLGGTRDMNDRQAVLQSLGFSAIKLGTICKRARLLRDRVLLILATLQEEGAVERVPIVDGMSTFEGYAKVEPVKKQDAKVLQFSRPPPAPFPPTQPPLQSIFPDGEEEGGK